MVNEVKEGEKLKSFHWRNEEINKWWIWEIIKKRIFKIFFSLIEEIKIYSECGKRRNWRNKWRKKLMEINEKEETINKWRKMKKNYKEINEGKWKKEI